MIELSLGLLSYSLHILERSGIRWCSCHGDHFPISLSGLFEGEHGGGVVIEIIVLFISHDLHLRRTLRWSCHKDHCPLAITTYMWRGTRKWICQRPLSYFITRLTYLENTTVQLSYTPLSYLHHSWLTPQGNKKMGLPLAPLSYFRLSNLHLRRTLWWSCHRGQSSIHHMADIWEECEDKIVIETIEIFS